MAFTRLALETTVVVFLLVFGTVSSWEPTSPGITEGYSLNNREYWEYKEKQCRLTCVIDVENWTVFPLTDPKLHRQGVFFTDPPTIAPATRETFATAIRTNNYAGTWGTSSWLVGNLRRRLVIMFFVPFYNVNEHVTLAVGLTKEGVTRDQSGWYRQMHQGDSNNYLTFLRQQFPLNSDPSRKVDFSHGGLRMIATTTTGEHARVTVKLMPTDPLWQWIAAPSVKDRKP